MATLSPIMLARFWGRVRVASEFRCWDWTGATSNGYGRFIRKKSHRIAYELINGPIPKGYVVRHRCDNPLCCNPYHLIAGTQAENARDAMERKRLPVGSRHPRTKLTPQQVAYIRRNPERLPLSQLAKKFGIAKSTCSYIRSGRSWRYQPHPTT